MNLKFDMDVASNYRSAAQVARVLTETWVGKNMFCPRCGNLHIQHFKNNQPVADFYCPICKSEYELKSKHGSLNHKINDGAYETIIQRITSNNNPDFFFMSYSKTEWSVKELIFVPKYFFTPDIIERRKPLSENARRAGWQGCNILIDKIPDQGRINIVSDGIISDLSSVLNWAKKCERLKTDDMINRCWLMDVLSCVNMIPYTEFSLTDIYMFENKLQRKHPDNHHIKAKIRQQLQLLRDKGFITFLGNGTYRKES